MQPGNVSQENQQSLRTELVLLQKIGRVYPLYLFFQEILNYRHSESLLLQFSSSACGQILSWSFFSPDNPSTDHSCSVYPNRPCLSYSPTHLLFLSDDLLAKSRYVSAFCLQWETGHSNTLRKEVVFTSRLKKMVLA